MQRTVLSYLMLTVAALCVVTSANSRPTAVLIAPGVVPDPTDDWRSLLRRDIEERSGGVVQRRQSPDERTTNDTAIEELDVIAWARETTLKCISKLRNVTRASNPSGIAVCYNLPFLNTKSGVFAADLRLYQVSAPEGEWAEASGNIDVSLVYKGAAVELRNETSEEAAATEQASANTEGPMKVQEFHFIGQIDKILLVGNPSDAELQRLLTPNISLLASTPSGTQLSTALSADEATFVNGIFTNTALLTQNDTAGAKDPAFQLPGTKFEIMPIGLYFYASYLFVACSIFGWGSFERQRFRDQFRQRVAWRGLPSGVRRR